MLKEKLLNFAVFGGTSRFVDMLGVLVILCPSGNFGTEGSEIFDKVQPIAMTTEANVWNSEKISKPKIDKITI